MVRKRRPPHTFIAVTVGALLWLFLLIARPAGLRQALGQTVGPAAPLAQICPNGQVVPLTQACPAIVVTSPAGPTTVVPIQGAAAITAAVAAGTVTGAAAQSVVPAPQAQSLVQGEVKSDVSAATTPDAATPAPAAPLPGAPIFFSSTTATADASQRAIVTADVLLTDPSGTTTEIQAASVDIPAGAACGGSGPMTITLQTNDATQPLGASLTVQCGSGPDAQPATALAAPATLCVSVPQYVLDDERADGGNNLTLIDANGAMLANGTFNGAQICGETTTTGTFTVAVVVPAS